MVAAAIGIGGTLLLPATALAQTFDVKQLDVTGGALEAASDNTVQGGIRRRDDNRSAHDLSLDYGVSNAWRFSGLIKLENPLDEDFRLAKSAVENIWVFRPVPKEGGLGLGWFTSVEVATDRVSTNESQFGPIVTLKDDKLAFTANPFLKRRSGATASRVSPSTMAGTSSIRSMTRSPSGLKALACRELERSCLLGRAATPVGSRAVRHHQA